MDGLPFSQRGEIAMQAEPVITRLMTDALAQPDLLSLAAGFTDNVALPGQRIRELVNRITESQPDQAYLQYGMNVGRPGLRQAVVELLQSYPGEDQLNLALDDVVITNGSQQALYISAQLFGDKGDIVLVERPSYFVFLELLKGLGLRPVSIPTREDGGIDLSGLDRLLSDLEANGELSRLKLVYMMGTFANPSTRCLEEDEKMGVVKLFKKRRLTIPIIEDMAYRELYFDSPYPARSALQLDAFEDYPLLYAGTFTKPFATGVKLGFVASHCSEWLQGIARIKGHQDFGSSNFNQVIIEEAWFSGMYCEHLAEVRGHYSRKMHLLLESLESNGLKNLGWEWEVPGGGLLLWVRGPDSLDADIGGYFHRSCLQHQVLYVPGSLCYAESPESNTVRLSFGALAETKLEEAGKRFCRAAEEIARSINA